MNIRIDDVLTWKNWNLSADVSAASKKAYASKEEAIGILQGAKNWLVTHTPENAHKIKLLINTKIKQLRNESLSDEFPEWLSTSSEPNQKRTFWYLDKSLVVLVPVIERKIQGNNEQNLIIPVLKRVAADPQAVQAMEKMDILLPQKITSKNWSLLLNLMDTKIKENLPESNLLKERAQHAMDIVLNEMMPREWCEKFKTVVQTPPIKGRLRTSRIALPPITRENCRQIYQALQDTCDRNEAPYLEKTFALIEKQMEHVCEKILKDMERRMQKQHAADG